MPQRALYRALLRSLRPPLGLSPPSRANLTRVLRAQFVQADPETLPDTIAATAALLASSPRLTNALASLAYHHHPKHLPHTRNALRLQWAPAVLPWDPELKQTEQLRKRRAKDAAEAQFGEGVDRALDEIKGMVEANQGVLLGRRPSATGGGSQIWTVDTK